MAELAQMLTLPGTTPGVGVQIQGPVGFNAGSNLGAVVSRLIPYFFIFSGIALLLMLIFGGFSLLMAGGDSKKIESGKQRITFAIVGFLIVFLSYWMVQLVGLIFGLTEFQDIFGP